MLEIHVPPQRRVSFTQSTSVNRSILRAPMELASGMERSFERVVGYRRALDRESLDRKVRLAVYSQFCQDLAEDQLMERFG